MSFFRNRKRAGGSFSLYRSKQTAKANSLFLLKAKTMSNKRNQKINTFLRGHTFLVFVVLLALFSVLTGPEFRASGQDMGGRESESDFSGLKV